jgi:HAD superfamily hydrolase (TIGR01509 family)
MSPIRFAFFDLDDTLVDTAAALRAWAVDFVREYRLDDDAADDVVERRTRASANWHEFIEHVRDLYSIATDPDELYTRMLVDYPAKFTLDPLVAEGLKRLRENGWRLGIVTNGLTAVQHAKIDRVDLRSYVDFVIASEAAGYDKPDVRIFELAAAELGVTLGPDGWMVGDMYDKDIRGGHAAGLRTVWIPGATAVPPPAEGPRPDHVVGSITEAIALVAGSTPGSGPDRGPAQ